MITRRRALAVVLAVWILGLAYVVQPRSAPRIPVHHAHPLDVPDADVPTLAPYQP